MQSELTRNPSRDEVAATLPGRWHVRATSSVAWLTGARDSPIFEYELASADPLVLNGLVTWIALNDSENRWHGSHHWTNGKLEWRRSGGVVRARLAWTVAAISTDGSIVVAKFAKTRASAGGVDALARDGVELDNLQTAVSRAPTHFGISAEEFTHLTWMVPPENR